MSLPKRITIYLLYLLYKRVIGCQPPLQHEKQIFYLMDYKALDPQFLITEKQLMAISHSSVIISEAAAQ